MRNTQLSRAAGVASLAGAVLHSLVIDAHIREWWGYGAFFMVAAVLEAVYGFVLVTVPPPSPTTPPGRGRRVRALYVAGIVGNLMVIGLWWVTRTVGVPWLGPSAGDVEPVGLIDITAKGVEALVVVALTVLLARARPGTTAG